MGCQKNADYVEITKTPIELFIRLTLADEAIEENGFGAFCINENQEVMVISNKQELLTNDINSNSLQSGDFILVRQLQGSIQTLNCIYVMEYLSGDTQVVGVFIDEISEMDSFAVDGNLVTGSHTGSLINLEGLEVPYTLSFSCGLTNSPDLCD
jgi:hypothetical protein